MAIYHLSVKVISRSSGRSATAAAAYRAGVLIADSRDGVVHDYRRKTGIVRSFLVAPKAARWAGDRTVLWNAAENAERRSNATVAREYQVALPTELSADARRELATRFALHLVSRYKIAADVAIHAPNPEGDQRNDHAHILTTTRVVEADGRLGAKTRVLDSARTGSGEIRQLRVTWATMANEALLAAGRSERIDHRSRVDAGLPGLGTKHMGPDLMAVERRRRREARQRDTIYVPGSRRARLNEEILQARQGLSVASREYRDIDTVEKGAGIARSQAAQNLAVLAPPLQSDLLVATAKAVARREAMKAAADRSWQSPMHRSPDALAEAAKAVAARQRESEIAGEKRLAEQAETELLHLRERVQSELEQLVRRKPALRSKQGAGFVRLAVRREDLASLSGDHTPTGRVLIACTTPQQRAALADRLHDHRPVSIMAVPIGRLSEICELATDVTQIRNWLVTIDKALSRTVHRLEERQKQAGAVRRSPGSDRGME